MNPERMEETARLIRGLFMEMNKDQRRRIIQFLKLTKKSADINYPNGLVNKMPEEVKAEVTFE